MKQTIEEYQTIKLCSSSRPFSKPDRCPLQIYSTSIQTNPTKKKTADSMHKKCTQSFANQIEKKAAKNIPSCFALWLPFSFLFANCSFHKPWAGTVCKKSERKNNKLEYSTQHTLSKLWPEVTPSWVSLFTIPGQVFPQSLPQVLRLHTKVRKELSGVYDSSADIPERWMPPE